VLEVRLSPQWIADHQNVAPQARVPSHATKHLKFEPREAQSESRAHAFEQDLANVVHPASVNVPRPRQERPAPQSESELQTVPADLSGVLPQAAKGISSAKSEGPRRILRIALILAPTCELDYRST